MKIKINKKVIEAIDTLPFNKTVKNNAYKIYATLYVRSFRANKLGWFECPSTLLKSINLRYYKIMKHFETQGIIEIYSTIDPNSPDIFNPIKKKRKSTSLGICYSYRFLINVKEGETMFVEMTNERKYKWYDITKNTLEKLGYDTKIKRDDFGRRVHHQAIYDYKEKLKGYYLIDAVASQPTLLYLELKRLEIIDTNYFDIFEKGLDFYEELKNIFNYKDREAAKKDFTFLLFSDNVVPTGFIKQFPQLLNYVKKVKSNNYKNLASHLQRIESKIWIDDILNNLPVDFALPVHDCLIVKPEDVDIVFDYIKNKYPELKIKKSII
jgi:hypothetical protein